VKQISCVKVGFSSDCEEVIEGETDDELMAAVLAHGRDVHGFADVELSEEQRDALLTDAEEM
jgi:predicted small metal-binding protein